MCFGYVLQGHFAAELLRIPREMRAAPNVSGVLCTGRGRLSEAPKPASEEIFEPHGMIWEALLGTFYEQRGPQFLTPLTRFGQVHRIERRTFL